MGGGEWRKEDWGGDGTTPNKISSGALFAHMYCVSRKWLVEAVIWANLKKRRMGKRVKEIKRKQKRRLTKRKEKRGGQMKRMFVRKTHGTGSKRGRRRKAESTSCLAL